MANVSEALRRAFNPNDGEGGRQIDYIIRFEALNDDALREAVPSAVEDAQISRLNQVKTRSNKVLKIATFEQNGWALDGSAYVPPRVSESVGSAIGLIMPDVSDDHGVYADPQRFSIEMDNPHNILAVSIDWGHYIPSDFGVFWFNGVDEIDSQNVSFNTNSTSLISHAVQDVTKIEVVVYRSAEPNKHVRIASFALGAILDYSRDNTEAITIHETLDPLSERTPTNTLTVIADNFARDFDIYNPDGIYAYFRDRMRLYPKIGALTVNGAYEYVDMGVYYLQAPKLKGNLSTIEFDAVDRRGILADGIYSVGRYNEQLNLWVVIQSLSEITGAPINADPIYQSMTMRSYIPTMSYAQLLAKLAECANTLVNITRDDQITLMPLPDTDMHVFTPDDYRMDGGISPEDDDPINTVVVEYTSYSVIDKEREEILSYIYPGFPEAIRFYVDNAVVYGSSGDVSIKYSPATDFVWYREGADKNIVRIMGRPIQAITASVTRSNRAASDPERVHTITANPFITTPEVAASVAEYQLNRRGAKRRSTSIKYRGYPYIQTTDGAKFVYGDSNAQSQEFFVIDNTLTLRGGGMTGTLKARES